MMSLLKLLLQPKLKRSHRGQKISGFTLLELLVAMILASIVIGTLLSFMVGMLNDDRREQAKVNSEQEIQAALDYITRDVQQAIYIYDGPGVTAISNQLPSVPSGTAGTTGVPVLVFWKRQMMDKVIPINASTNCTTTPANCDDAYVYSLVAYYLIKDSCAATNTWSCTTRIGRVQIKDGVVNPLDPTNTDGTPKYLTGYGRDPGYKAFDVTQAGNKLSDKMNNWQKQSGEAYTNNIETLIDYIDQSTSGVPSIACPTGTSRTPIYSPDTGAVSTDFQTYSFFACVNTDQTVAQVFIRGNALARIRSKTTPPTYNSKQTAFFPSANLQVKGRGFLNAN